METVFYFDKKIFGTFESDEKEDEFTTKFMEDENNMAHYLLDYPVTQQMAMIMALLQDLATHYKRDVTEMKWLLNQVGHKVIRSRDWFKKDAAEKLEKKQEGGN